MRPESNTSLLSTVFVDYDNIYLSLKRKSADAAAAFAKDANRWVGAIASGELITDTNGPALSTARRIVMNRCYGNPIPRRNSHDNKSDMNSFPFVRHHFLRSGFEVIDCPPLTAQLKNSADIRMVMDVRDYLNHDTYFDEFVILSGDADFTPVLHRLRAHARRTVIFSNDHTAAPYKAISDGEVREADLIALLTEGRAAAAVENTTAARASLPGPDRMAEARSRILAEVANTVSQAGQPVPLEALADRAVRQLGHEMTIATSWAGAGSFRDLLTGHLPASLAITEHPPFLVFEAGRQVANEHAGAASLQSPPMGSNLPDAAKSPAVGVTSPALQPTPQQAPQPAVRPNWESSPQQAAASTTLTAAVAKEEAAQASAHAIRRTAPPARMETTPTRTLTPQQAAASAPRQTPAAPASAPAAAPNQQAPAVQSAAPPSSDVEGATAIQRSIARIQEACQAPALSPHAYGILFASIAQEISGNGLAGTQTLANIGFRAKSHGVELNQDDIRFVLEVISDNDPWFDQGISANLFASRFRNFVIMRCRSQGLNLSAAEIDLIEAWFMSGGPASSHTAATQTQATQANASATTHDQQPQAAAAGGGFAGSGPLDPHGDSLPRFVRGR